MQRASGRRVPYPRGASEPSGPQTLRCASGRAQGWLWCALLVGLGEVIRALGTKIRYQTPVTKENDGGEKEIICNESHRRQRRCSLSTHLGDEGWIKWDLNLTGDASHFRFGIARDVTTGIRAESAVTRMGPPAKVFFRSDASKGCREQEKTAGVLDRGRRAPLLPAGIHSEVCAAAVVDRKPDSVRERNSRQHGRTRKTLALTEAPFGKSRTAARSIVGEGRNG